MRANKELRDGEQDGRQSSEGFIAPVLASDEGHNTVCCIIKTDDEDKMTTVQEEMTAIVAVTWRVRLLSHHEQEREREGSLGMVQEPKAHYKGRL